MQPSNLNDVGPPIDLPEEVYAVPEGDWVVLSADERRMVAHHPVLRTAIEEAERLGEPNGVLLKAVGLRDHWII